MEGESNIDHLPNPEQKDPIIPFFKAEISSSIDPQSEAAKRITSCFNGYNHLVDLYKRNVPESELSSIMPDFYSNLHRLVFPPQPQENDEPIEPPQELPEIVMQQDDPLRVISINNETELNTMLAQARLFTHGIGNIAHRIRTANEVLAHIAPDKDLAAEEEDHELGIRELLKTNLLDAQEKLNNEMIIENISPAELGSKLESFMRTFLVEERLYMSVEPELAKLQLKLPIWWLSVAAADIAQNIRRKEERDGVRLQTTLNLSLDKATGMLRIKVEDNGAPYPQKFVDHGFKSGEGENEGGKHIAMAAHSETAESIGGRVYVFNDFDEDEQQSYAQTNILLPLEVETPNKRKKGQINPQQETETITSAVDQQSGENELPHDKSD